MTTGKKLGIWMDHANAHLIELENDKTEKKTIASKFTHEAKETSLQRSEIIMHDRKQHQTAEYYKALAEEIKNYKSVLLFGPTEAKAELFNTLKGDSRFKEIKIEVLAADKMTDHQQQAFVRNHFANS